MAPEKVNLLHNHINIKLMIFVDGEQYTFRHKYSAIPSKRIVTLYIVGHANSLY
jgi:hypothetical protein